MPATIGILALQGNFQQHSLIVRQLGAQSIFVRTAKDLQTIDGLILPGGESTTMAKLLNADISLRNEIIEFAKAGNPILGTCAGLILMAKSIGGDNSNVGDGSLLGLIDVEVERNAYGPQVHSDFHPIETSTEKQFSVSFIRAPKILHVGEEVEVLAEFSGNACAVREDKCVGLTFHPELTKISYFHQLAFSDILDKGV